MGYEGIRPSFAAEFDIFGQNDGDPDGNHVGFLTDGKVNNALNPDSWTSSDVPPLYGNGPIHAWLDYAADTHRAQLFVSDGSTKPSSPTLDITRDLSADVGAHSAFVGFTAATGGCNAAQDVLSWHLNAFPGANDHIAPTSTDAVPTSPSEPATAPVPVTLTATDNAGGTGVKEIRYTIGDTTNPPVDPTAPGANDNVYSGEHKPTLLNNQVISYSAIDNAGNFESSHTSAAAQVTATVRKAILDADKVGQTIHANDTDPTPSNATLTYQWYRATTKDGAGTPIEGETGASYQITEADLGSYVGVIVTATADGYQTATSDSGTTSEITDDRDKTAPTTSDSVPGNEVNHLVTVTLTSSDSGSGVKEIHYAIGTASAPGDPSTSGLTSSDDSKPVLSDGQVISYYAVDNAGNVEATKTSAPAQVVTAITKPTITGSATIDSTLQAAATPTPSDASVTYQWNRVKTNGISVAIPGATGSSYKVTKNDKGSTLTVTATAAKDGFGSTSGTSDPTAVVAAAAPIPAFDVTGDGGRRVGEVRHAHTTVDGDGSLTLTYQWQKANGQGGWADLPGAAAKQADYELPPAVMKVNIRVLVTATRGALTRQKASAPLVILPGTIYAHNPVVTTAAPKVGQDITGSVTVDNTNIADLDAVYTWTFTGKRGFKKVVPGKTVTVPAGANAAFFTVRLTATGYNNNELRSPSVTVAP